MHWILFFLSAKVSRVSVCLVGLSTCTLFTAFVEPVIKKRALQLGEILFGFFVVFGIYLIFRFETEYFVEFMLALGAAFLAAVFSVYNSIC